MDTAELVRHIFLILLGNSLCLILLDRKYSLRKTLLIYGTVTAAVIFLGTSIFVLLGMDTLLSFYPIIINGITLTALFFLSKRKGFPVIFTMLTVVVICTIITLPVSFLARTVGLPIWTEILLKTIVAVIISVLLYRYLRPAYLEMYAVIQKGWGYLCLIPGLYYALVLPNITYIFSAYDGSYEVLLTCMLALFIVIIAYGVVFNLLLVTIRETEMRDKQQLLKIQMQAMERQTDMMKETEEKTRIYSHNLRRYLSNVQMLLESGDTEEALRVLGSYEEQHKNTTSVTHYCDNPIVNAILVYYIQKAEQKGIAVDIDCRLPQNLPLESLEYAMVLANAIENAINACSKVSEDRERLIHIKTVSSPQLALEIVNSYAGTVKFDESGLPVSNQINHGLGTKSIAAFVEKYDGIIEYSADSTLFRLRLLVAA